MLELGTEGYIGVGQNRSLFQVGGFMSHDVEACKQIASLGRNKDDRVAGTRQDPIFNFKAIMFF